MITSPFVSAYLAGKSFDVSAAEAAIASASKAPPPVDPRTSEDCLFLDIIVPQSIFQKANRTKKSTAPTLVWIHGGGYTGGEKSYYNPAGLFNASRAASPDGVVFVAINYRVRFTHGYLETA